MCLLQRPLHAQVQGAWAKHHTCAAPIRSLPSPTTTYHVPFRCCYCPHAWPPHAAAPGLPQRTHWQGLLYPLDTIRTRLALAPTGTYRGILHAMYRLKRDEGAAAFYRGLAPSMVGILPFAGVDIALFEVIKVRSGTHGPLAYRNTLLQAGVW